MTENTYTGGAPQGSDLEELDFTPITNEEVINLKDRTYLLGVHSDGVR